jgi:methenyltetrahydrofolate cyclohydrolase
MTVKEQTLAAYLEALASTAAVPGGGSAAAIAAAMGAALLSMVAKLSARRARTDHARQQLMDLVPELDDLMVKLLDLSQEDIDAYRAVIESRKSGGSPDDLQRRYEQAADVPLATASAATRGLALGIEVSRQAWEMTASDLAAATELLETGLSAALGNVAINLPELSPQAAARIEPLYRELRARQRR